MIDGKPNQPLYFYQKDTIDMNRACEPNIATLYEPYIPTIY